MFNYCKKIIIVIMIVVAGFISCEKNNYVEYKPHYLSGNNENKYYGDSELDTVMFLNIRQVLEYYGEDYKVKDGNVILITKELNAEWELLWNYTSKANNAEWLHTHKPKPK